MSEEPSHDLNQPRTKDHHVACCAGSLLPCHQPPKRTEASDERSLQLALELPTLERAALSIDNPFLPFTFDQRVYLESRFNE